MKAAFDFYITMKVLITTLILKLLVVPRYHINCIKLSPRANAGRMKHSVLHCGMEPEELHKGRDSQL